MKISSRILILFLFIIFSSTFHAQYCMPSADCSVGDGVTEFGMGSVFNASGCSSDFGIDGYADFTNISVLVGQGSVETVVLRSGFANQQFSIWIDADNSISFEESELILIDEPVGLDQVTTSVLIPAGLAFGEYTMRVQANFAAPSSTDPCTMGTFGETEDYTVVVGPPPTCIAVIDVMANAVTSNSALISWTDQGTGSVWDIEFGPAGFTPTGMPSPGYDDVSNPALITGLDPATDYQVYVRADCGMDNTSDVSFWSAPISFTTECAPITPFYLNDMNTLPLNCWEFANGGMLSEGPQNFDFSNWFDGGFANVGFTGAQSTFFFGPDDNQWMLTPFFDLSGGSYQAEFDVALTEAFGPASISFGSDDFIAFAVSEDLGLSWDLINIWDANNPLSATGEHSVNDLSSFTGNEIRFAFLASSGIVDDFIQFEVHVDNFVIQDLGACIVPFSVQVSNISATEAQVQWTDPGSSSAWDIEFGPIGFTPTGNPSPGFDDVSNPVVLTGLDPITEYEVYVRADCSQDNSSNISFFTSPISFTTECASLVPFYANDFNTIPFDCWDFANGGNIMEGPQNFDFSNWFDGGFGNLNTFTGSQGVTFFGPLQYQWMLSPFFDLSGGTYQVEFDFALTQAFNSNEVTLGSDDHVVFASTEDFGSTWDIIQQWDSSSVVAPSGEHFIFDLSGNTSTDIRFAFLATTDSIDDSINFEAHVDNFIVQDLGAPISSQIDDFFDLNCGGDSSGVVLISVNGGIPPYSFLWSDGSTSEDLVGADAGEHYVTIIDGSGMEILSDTVILDEPEPIVITADITDESVNGANDGAIDITVSGGTGPYTFQWNNGSIEEDIDGLIDALWCVDVTDIFGCTTEACFTVMMGPTGINEINGLNSMNAFPNPAKEEVTLNLDFDEFKNLEINLRNTLGEIIYSRNAFGNLINENFNLNGFASGIYFIEVRDLNSTGIAVQKIMVK